MARARKKRTGRDESRRDTRDREAQEIDRLREENDRLRKQLEEQAKRIADLERQLALKQQNSTITSKPPSSDGLAGQQRARGRRVKSRRKAGGQPGHPGRHRELVPVERVHAIVDFAPDACRGCARRLHARHRIGEPRRHQVTELPAIAAHITEYRCYRRQCPDCGMITLAPLPDEHANHFGPHLTALVAYLTVVCRMPRLVVQRFLEGALQIPISLGSTQNAWEETSAAVAGPYAELEAALSQEAVVNADETGHRTNGEKRWLWTFVARTFVFYRIAASRGSDVLRTVLGESFPGILGSDRLPAYLKYVAGQRQFCWAHVTRNLLSALDLASTPTAKRFGCSSRFPNRLLNRALNYWGNSQSLVREL
jgi:transposase